LEWWGNSRAPAAASHWTITAKVHSPTLCTLEIYPPPNSKMDTLRRLKRAFMAKLTPHQAEAPQCPPSSAPIQIPEPVEWLPQIPRVASFSSSTTAEPAPRVPGTIDIYIFDIVEEPRARPWTALEREAWAPILAHYYPDHSFVGGPVESSEPSTQPQSAINEATTDHHSERHLRRTESAPALLQTHTT
jgi:hypothetical protein